MTWNIISSICLLLCIVATVKSVEEIDSRQILLSFYTCKTKNSSSSIECTIRDLKCIANAYRRVQKNRNDITVYIHGFLGNKESKSVQQIVTAYCSRRNSIIALLDWSSLATGEAIIVGNRLPRIAEIVASTFNMLNIKRYDVNNWHLIGHSMGAHIAGCIGRATNFTFAHITALEPGGTFFYTSMYKGCLFNPKVAQFTDAFYTDVGGFGAKDNGALNLYGNNGMAPQPGCQMAEDPHWCSHFKAVEWYADAVRNKFKYSARDCEDCFALVRFDYCNGNNHIYLGPDVDKHARGTYCISIVG